jgi:hypothetical protein
MHQVEDVELPNSHKVVEVGLDEIPSTLGVDSEVLHFPLVEVKPIHVIFDLNGVLIATRFDKVLAPSFSILDSRNSRKNVLHNSKSIFGLRPNVIYL